MITKVEYLSASEAHPHGSIVAWCDPCRRLYLNARGAYLYCCGCGEMRKTQVAKSIDRIEELPPMTEEQTADAKVKAAALWGTP